MPEVPALLTGEQEFAELRERGCLYVDKTDYIAEMILHGKYYFLSRPRWFGKSMTVSTLDALFSGERELFSGLAIEKHLDHKYFQPGRSSRRQRNA